MAKQRHSGGVIPLDVNETVNLEDILSKPVETPADQNPVFDEENAETDDVHYFEPVIDEEKEQEPVTSQGDDSFMPPQAIAETIVNLLDGLQSSVVPFLRERKIFTATELDILQRIDLSGNTVYTSSSAENVVLAKWKKHQAIVAKIPFNKGEKNRLVQATARYAETTDMKVSPLAGLMLAYSEVIVTRSAYFFQE